MITFKTSLLAATVIAGIAAAPAFAADTALPLPAAGLPATTSAAGVNYDGDSALHGAGATSVQNVLVRVANCLGSTPTQLGNGQPAGAGAANNGSLGTVANGAFAGAIALTCNGVVGSSTADTAPNTNAIQPNFQTKYVGTGSGFGRKMWYIGGDIFDGGEGTANSAAILAQKSGHAYVDGVPNPFVTVGQNTWAAGVATNHKDNHWSRIQFAISDAPLSAGELANYNKPGNAGVKGGAAIQFPLFVLPVAVVYNSVYGKNAAGANMVFNAQYAAVYPDAHGSTTTIQSIKLDTATLCGIFNGDITNWNDAKIQALNGKNLVKKVNVGIPLFDAVNDTAARWAADGAPIRLVGRLDNSGTTDVFTRHLAAVCTSTNGYTGVNKYKTHAESLPFNSTTIDFTTVRADSNYKPANAGNVGKVAGDTNMVSADYFDGSAIKSVTGPSSLPVGNQGSGLFLVANGGSKLVAAIAAAPDYVLNDTTNGNATLNGKIGYISADNIQPSVDAKPNIVAAALVNHNSGRVTIPTNKTALAALGGILPPQTLDTTGAFAAVDSRTITDGTTTRDNPLAWTEVLYLGGTQPTLADPAAGYPITGTTQFLGYTCYANEGTRAQIAALLGALTGKLTKNSHGLPITATTFNGVAPATPGIVAQANIAIVPVAWQKAIANTFLSSTSDAGSLNLYIQNAVLPTFGQVPVDPTKPRGTKVLGVKTPTTPNPSCASL